MNYTKFSFQCPSIKCPSLEHSYNNICSMTVFLLQQQSRMVEIQIIWPAKPKMFTIWPFAKKKKSLPTHHLQKSQSSITLTQVNIYQDESVADILWLLFFSYDHFKRVNYKPQYYVWLFSYQFQSHPGCFLLSRGIKVSLHKTCVLILDLEKKKKSIHTESKL